CHPALVISNSTDSRTEMSSSTTNTTGVSGMPQTSVADGLARPWRGRESVEQGRVVERLEQNRGGLGHQEVLSGIENANVAPGPWTVPRSDSMAEPPAGS